MSYHSCSYIYIYIYCHPQTDCFVLSELFSVARHAGRSKPGSKPVQLYVRLSLSRLFTFFNTLSATRVLNSFEELCITLAVADNSFPMGERIYCHPQTDYLSELISVARHAGRLKPGSKPVQLYVRLSLRPLGHQADHVGKGNF